MMFVLKTQAFLNPQGIRKIPGSVSSGSFSRLEQADFSNRAANPLAFGHRTALKRTCSRVNFEGSKFERASAYVDCKLVLDKLADIAVSNTSMALPALRSLMTIANDIFSHPDAKLLAIDGIAAVAKNSACYLQAPAFKALQKLIKNPNAEIKYRLKEHFSYFVSEAKDEKFRILAAISLEKLAAQTPQVPLADVAALAANPQAG